MSALTRQKSTLFQRLAVPLWVPTGKDIVPTDSGAFRSQFCGREIVNAVLIVGGVAFEKAAHTASHSARTRPSVTRRHRLALQTIENRVRPLRAYWSVYELTHRAPGSRRAAGSRSTRTECPRICWHTIFSFGNPQRYGKPLKQPGFLPRSGGHSSRYWCQQDQVPSLGRRWGGAALRREHEHVRRIAPRTGARQRADRGDARPAA